MIDVKKEDIAIVKQRVQERYVRLNILDFQYRIIDEISGNLIEFSLTNDATSDLRRSCNVSLVVFGKDAYKLQIAPTAEIFLDKFIQPYVGIKNFRTGEIQWYSQGIFLINRPTWDWDAQNNTLKFEGADLMAKLTGARNGQLEGIPTVIKAGENVRQAIISTLALAGFTNYIVSECTLDNGEIQPVPNDITVNQGGTVYDILNALRNILPNYQIYFDIDGVFHYDKIPTGKDEPIILDDDTIRQVLISESINTDFEAVKNYIEVYGRSHDVQHYATSVAESGAVVGLTIGSLTTISTDVMIGWTTTAPIAGTVYLNVNAEGNRELVDESGTNVGTLDGDTYYVAVRKENGQWLFLGHQQARAIVYDDNPQSPFYVGGSVGRIRYVCIGGDYDNIQSDYLALQRAKYELYIRDRLQDTISLYTIPIPWLDVNVLIRHIAKDETQARDYMIQSISYSIGAGETMSIIANQYYPNYSD